MNQAGGKGETLFPSAGKLAGELLFAFGQPQFLHALTHSLPSVLHTVHARDEIEIFLNTQILPKTESLRHVPYFALDRLTLIDHVVTQDLPGSVVGAEQSAKHSQKGGLAAAVRAEKSVNFAGPHG